MCELDGVKKMITKGGDKEPCRGGTADRKCMIPQSALEEIPVRADGLAAAGLDTHDQFR